MRQLLLSSFLFFFFLICLPSINAQNTDTWVGKWEGAIEIPGTSLELNIELTNVDNNWAGTMSIPAQRLKEMPLTDLKIEGNAISFALPDVPGGATFSGTLDNNKISGTFSQMGQSFPMNLTKQDALQTQALQQKIDQIRHLVDSLYQQAEVPGMALGLIYKGETQLLDGFGYRNMEKQLPVDASTLFAIGSSSKAFTTMGLGLLADDGMLDWDEPVKNYLRDFQLFDPFATKEMTTIDLVTHRSGLPRHDILWYLSDYSRDELYSRLQYLEPSASFRSKWQYQNLMYMTAGVLTERISGDTWEAFVDSRIFKPLGMQTANFSVKTMANSDNASLGYGEKDGEITILPYHNIDAVGPAGSINASVTDMLQWLKLHLGDGSIDGQGFINKNTLEKMHRPHMAMENNLLPLPGFEHPSYGLGWFIYDYDGLYIVEHGGNIDGFSALVFMIPDEELGMVFLTNKNGTALSYLLAYSITDRLLDRDETDWYGLVYGSDEEEEEEEEETTEEPEEDRRVENTQPQHALEDYVGTYKHKGYGEVNVTLEEGQLVATYFKLSMQLEHWHYETFFGEDETIELEIKPTFETDRDGRVVALREKLETSLPGIRFVKQASDQLSDPDFLENLTGLYGLPGERLLEISRRGNRIFAFIEGQPEYELVPLQDLEFSLKQLDGFTMEFIKEAGKIVAVVSHQPNGHIRAERKE